MFRLFSKYSNRYELEIDKTKKLFKLFYFPVTRQYSTSKTEQKTIRVAVIGVPNSGKSTFINNLINHRVCPISSKVHTTRRANTAIHTERDTQVILFDTPGLVTKREIKKHNLDSSFNSAYRHSIQHADAIAVIHDVSNKWTRHQLHHTVVDTLQSYPKLPSFLVLNKIDLLKSKRILLDLTNNFINTKSPENEDEKNSSKKNKFSNVFMVSSLLDDGVSDVLRHIQSLAKIKEWQFSANLFTDEKPEYLITENVRARLLDYLPQEIPYLLKCEIEHFSAEENIIYATVQVECPSARIERLICGESNGKLKQITERVTSDLVETFNKAISLTICTRAKKSVSEARN